MSESLRYIGTKIITGTPMSLGDYNEYRCWTMPDDENPAREGYLVIYEGGYESWSPKDVFDAAYRLCDAMTFGLALEAAKKGKKIARPDYNGRYLALSEKQEVIAGEVHKSECIVIVAKADEYGDWYACPEDILAEDWMIVD